MFLVLSVLATLSVGRTQHATPSVSHWELKSHLTERTPILTFHDVIASRDSQALWFDVSVPELESQLDWLTKHGAHFVTLDQVFEHLTRGTHLPPNAIALTFADGYEGFYQLGLPILRRRHIPATMFVHTSYVGDQHGRPKMSWDQLKELDREGLVSICSQTQTHPEDLRTLTAAQLESEMVGSKRILERRLGHVNRFLAYPNGKFDTRVARAAQKAGYEMAFTERLTPAEKSPNRFMVSRYVHTKFKRAWSDAGRR